MFLVCVNIGPDHYFHGLFLVHDRTDGLSPLHHHDLYSSPYILDILPVEEGREVDTL